MLILFFKQIILDLHFKIDIVGQIHFTANLHLEEKYAIQQDAATNKSTILKWNSNVQKATEIKHILYMYVHIIHQ